MLCCVETRQSVCSRDAEAPLKRLTVLLEAEASGIAVEPFGFPRILAGKPLVLGTVTKPHSWGPGVIGILETEASCVSIDWL